MSLLLTITDWPNWGMLVVTLAALAVAAAAMIVNALQYLSQTSPDIVVYASQDQFNRNIILLVIENIGKSSARAIRFYPSRPLPVHAYGVTEEEAARREAEVMNAGPFISGIPFLPPGGKRIISWGQYRGLARALEGKVVQIDAEYDGEYAFGWFTPRLKTSSFVDIQSFFHCDATEPLSPGDRQLKKIAETLDHVATGHKKPLVRTISERQHAGEQEAFIHEAREAMQAQGPAS